MKKLNYSFKAVGSIIEIIIIGEEENSINSLINFVYDEVNNFENKYSRFIKDSMLCKLNKEKYLEVDKDFMALVLKSKEIHKLTNGYFNPLVNISNIGYSDDFENGKIEKTDEKENLNFSKVNFFGDYLKIQDGMNLDFGGIGKGFLADKIKEILLENGQRNFLVNVGGDITTSGKNLNGKDWQAGIEDPFNGGIIKKISLQGKSISTSGSYHRNRNINSQNYHHIKTPGKEEQEQEAISVTIIDNFAYKTDSLATSILSMGIEKGKNFCIENNISCIIINNKNEVIEV